jgi:hypothetical protein
MSDIAAALVVSEHEHLFEPLNHVADIRREDRIRFHLLNVRKPTALPTPLNAGSLPKCSRDGPSSSKAFIINP